MEKTLIITSHLEHADSLTVDFSEFNKIICADGGLLIAQKLGLSPDFLIGDYDSMNVPSGDVIKLPMEKDMTDSEAAIDLAVSKGYKDITLLGGLGGRFDHTMGNIGMLAKFCGTTIRLSLIDGQNYLFMVAPGTYTVPKNAYTYLGIISYGDDAKNVTLRGVKYPLTNHHLTNKTTLGVSNEIICDSATVSFTDGMLLIILSKDL
ncbi:thiamine diphosphokinase [Anaerotruncus sp. 80]|uniref:Thiamine diphosphokinase n=1 Tax=Anaerotruncus colihominis TaxID=169435 RepID=A0A845QJS7_9FIRM|nr:MULTISPECIES: thiamine diphosphokinase [Anaerotruncus]NBH62370.1 thiamine diphosphokinase [Anaerotruncus colihominis]NCF03025.1 thiamine diphosphokinase [Anaerotruncus sp. 80]